MFHISAKTRRFLISGMILVVISYFVFYKVPRRNATKVETSFNLHKYLAKKLQCQDIPLEMQRIQYGSYWLLQNLIRGNISRSIGCADSITYATNADYTFFGTLETMVKRWRAPISFALYTPGYDFNDSMESIQYVRNCLPESNLIQQFVTFHIFFPAEHMPPVLPLSEDEALNWSYDCFLPPYTEEKKIHKLYRKVHNMTYPINVGRNIARKAANTYFIFTSDIELFPSPGLVDRFLQMVAKNISVVVNDPGKEHKPRVFPLNVFELQNNASLPNSKQELKEMLAKKQAVRFHSRVCSQCHLLPYKTEWLNLTKVNEISVLGVAKRQGKFKYWEPFYISDNKEPMFDERVTWEGQKNKRIQGFAMCLMDYEYHILSDGFLVHSPGIKKFNKKSPRLKYVPPMNALIRKTIRKEYVKLYGKNKHCHV